IKRDAPAVQRSDQVRSSLHLRHMTGGTVELHKELLTAPRQAPVVIIGEDQRRRWCKKTNESGHLLDVLDANLRIRRRVGVGRHRGSIDGLFHRRKRSGDSHFLRKSPGVEIEQRGYRRFTAESPNASINRAVGMAPDTVAIGLVDSFARHDRCLSNGVHQPEAEKRRGGAPRLSGGCWRDLLFFDSFGLQQLGSLLLDDRPALVEERITEIRRNEPRGMHFHLVADASYNWSFMTRGTGISIEQRTEAVFWFKDTLKYLFPFLELGALVRRQAGKRFAQGRRLLYLASAQTKPQE